MKRLLRSVMVLMTGEGAARVLGVAALAILARALGVEQFGILAFAMSLAMVLSVAIDMGQNVHIGRVVANDASQGPGNIAHVAVNKCALALVLMAVAAVGTRLAGSPPNEVGVVALMIVWAAGLSVLDSLRAVARAVGGFRSDSAINALESLLRVAVLLVAWKLSWGLLGFAAAFAFESVVAVIGYWAYLAGRLDLSPQVASLSASFQFFRDALPLGIASLGLAGFYRIDQVLVRYLGSASASGLYGAAARVTLTANIVSALVMMAAYPDLVRLKERPFEFSERMRQALFVALTLSALVAGSVFLLAGPIVKYLYGAEFAASVHLLRVLSLVIFLNSLTVVSLHTANSLGRERKAVAVVLVLTAINIVSNVVLIPRYGADAAAWTSSIGEGLMGLGLLSLSLDRLFMRRGRETAAAERASA